MSGTVEGHQSGSELQCRILTCIHPLIFSLSSLTAAYWQKSPLRRTTAISPGCLTTEAAPLGAKVSTESVSKINRSMSTTHSWPLSFHLLRYSRAAGVNIWVSVLMLSVLTGGKSFLRKPSTPPSRRYRCVGDLTSDWSSAVCCLLSIVIVICSSSTNWRYRVEYIKQNALENVDTKMLFQINWNNMFCMTFLYNSLWLFFVDSLSLFSFK